MKVKCEYCEGYVEADENEKCPLCNAPLGSAIAAERAREAQAEQALREQEAEEQAREAKDAHISDIIKGVASVATALAAGTGMAGASASHRPAGHHGGPPRDGMHAPGGPGGPGMGGMRGPGGPGMRR